MPSDYQESVRAQTFRERREHGALHRLAEIRETHIAAKNQITLTPVPYLNPAAAPAVICIGKLPCKFRSA